MRLQMTIAKRLAHGAHRNVPQRARHAQGGPWPTAFVSEASQVG